MRHQKPLLMRLWFVSLKYVFNWIHCRWLQRCRRMIGIIGLIVCHLTPLRQIRHTRQVETLTSWSFFIKYLGFYKLSWLLIYFLANVCKVLTYRQYVIICHANDMAKMGKNSRSECTWTAAISLCLVEEGVVARRRRSAGVDGFEQERLPFIRPESCYSRRHEWCGHRLIDRDSRTRFAAFLATCRQSLGPA